VLHHDQVHAKKIEVDSIARNQLMQIIVILQRIVSKFCVI
jgi:hypothetical protein